MSINGQHISSVIQGLSEQLREIMESTGASYDQMQRSLAHACNAGGRLDPWESTTAPLQVHWEVEAACDPETEESVPARAAHDAWQRSFNRGSARPTADQACTFVVVDPRTGKAAMIDLAHPECMDLFIRDGS